MLKSWTGIQALIIVTLPCRKQVQGTLLQVCNNIIIIDLVLKSSLSGFLRAYVQSTAQCVRAS